MPLDTRLEDYVREVPMNVFIKRRLSIALAESPMNPIIRNIHDSAKRDMPSDTHAELAALIEDRLSPSI